MSGGERIAADAARTEDLLGRLVAIPSVNPSLAPGGSGEAAVARCLAAECEALGMTVAIEEAAPGRPNVVAVLEGAAPARGRRLLLNGHTDTVGAGAMPDAFRPIIRGRRLYGRGAFDMKAGLAAMVGAVEAVLRAGLRPSGDVVLAFVADEEDASLGTAALVRGRRADGAIVTEPTGLRVCVAHKGFLWATIHTEGRAAHGSDYTSGRDAIADMGRVLGAIERLDREVLAGRIHPLLGRPSIHASVIAGGEAASIYPSSCRLVLERRTLPGEPEAAVRAELEEILAQLRRADPGLRARMDVTLVRPGLEVDPDVPVVRALDRAVRAHAGMTAAHIGMSPWFDAALLAGAGIPTVIFGPTGGGWHGDEEYVDLGSVTACAEILAATIAEFCATPP